jgi:phage-related protein (TIGR01555 family)
MQAQSIMESNFGTRIINKGDAIHNTQYTFTGLSDVYECMMMDVAGAARIPVTKLFGRSPAGMNSTGESDMRNYYDYIDSIRDTTFRGIIERLLPVLAMSAWGKIPDDLDIDFEPMQTPNNIEIADIAQKKTAAIVQAYQSDLIDLETARKELQALDVETGMFGKLSDALVSQGRGVTYSASMQMRDPMAGIFAEPVPEDEPEPANVGGDVG